MLEWTAPSAGGYEPESGARGHEDASRAVLAPLPARCSRDCRRGAWYQRRSVRSRDEDRSGALRILRLDPLARTLRIALPLRSCRSPAFGRHHARTTKVVNGRLLRRRPRTRVRPTWARRCVTRGARVTAGAVLASLPARCSRDCRRGARAIAGAVLAPPTQRRTRTSGGSGRGLFAPRCTAGGKSSLGPPPDPSSFHLVATVSSSRQPARRGNRRCTR